MSATGGERPEREECPTVDEVVMDCGDILLFDVANPQAFIRADERIVVAVGGGWSA